MKTGSMKCRQVSFVERIIAIIEEARQKVAYTANLAQVYTNYEIGRQIVEEEQGGKRRAGYGEKVLIDLSQRLTARFGRGWSVENLKLIRRFYLVYSDWVNSVCPIDGATDLVNGVCQIGMPVPLLSESNSARASCRMPRFSLSWSHYLLLMRIEDPVERAFYEREAAQGNWSFRQLERMYRASTFERLELSKDKKKVRALMSRPAPDVTVAGEALKDPIVTEFLGLPEKYTESELEKRIFDHLQDFMLEMGKGFTFHGRQVRCVIGDHSYYVDLAFYNRFTRSFFLIDLKLKNVGHGELGQMQTYVNYFDRVMKIPEENPTVGILLTSEKVDHALVEMFLPDDAKDRIFVKQYTEVLPSKLALKRIVIEEKRKYEKEQKLLALAVSKKRASMGGKGRGRR